MTTVRTAGRQTDRRKATRALLLSVLIHVALILTIAWFYASGAFEPSAPVDEVSITLIQPPAEPEKNSRFIDTSAPESQPDENARFESDRDTAAASPDAAKGGEALPSQDGSDQKFLELEQQALALAKPDTAPPAPEVPPAPPKPPEPVEPQPTPAERTESQLPQPEESIAVSAPTPKPKPKEPRETQPPQPSAKPSFQRYARPTRISGSVSNRGRAAVASMATPLGRYRKAISDAIGSSWYHFIGPRMDLFSYGTVSVVFTVDRTGKVRQPRVISNSSNESFEIVTLESILAAEIPPIPPDILPTLEGGQIEIDYTFSIITN
ncbi:MAG: hypothetical protein FGM15_04930 [Chthoniobacterales bacterium]|nr:hypothetical protein [Chthoniobacterales bacterium]